MAHLSEAQKQGLVIADNQLALNFGWDEELHRVELAILHERDYDLELLGFDDVELARLPAAQDAYPDPNIVARQLGNGGETEKPLTVDRASAYPDS